jgi:hypothetical protein
MTARHSSKPIGDDRSEQSLRECLSAECDLYVLWEVGVGSSFEEGELCVETDSEDNQLLQIEKNKMLPILVEAANSCVVSTLLAYRDSLLHLSKE